MIFAYQKELNYTFEISKEKLNELDFRLSFAVPLIYFHVQHVYIYISGASFKSQQTQENSRSNW